VEVIVFPEVFKAALPCLRGGDPVLVRGTLDLSEEHIKIKGTEIRSLPEVPLSTEKTFHLKIPLTSLTKSLLADLKEIITAHKGFYKVVLHLTDGKDRETVIAFSDQYQVDPSQTFQEHIRVLFKSPVIHLE
jgi:DNA polymerase III alpha subunit